MTHKTLKCHFIESNIWLCYDLTWPEWQWYKNGKLEKATGGIRGSFSDMEALELISSMCFWLKEILKKRLSEMTLSWKLMLCGVSDGDFIPGFLTSPHSFCAALLLCLNDHIYKRTMLLISSSIPPPSFGNRWTQNGIKRLTVNPSSIPQRCWDEKENSLWLELWIQLQPPSLICRTSSLQLLNHMNQTCDPPTNYAHRSLEFQHGGDRHRPSDLCYPRPVSTFRSRTALFTSWAKAKKNKRG